MLSEIPRLLASCAFWAMSHENNRTLSMVYKYVRYLFEEIRTLNTCTC